MNWLNTHSTISAYQRAMFSIEISTDQFKLIALLWRLLSPCICRITDICSAR